jgi:hypothetical protein
LEGQKGRGQLAEETRQEVQLPIAWAGTEDVSIALVNQFLGQVGLQDEVILTFGQLTPPALLGTPEQQRQQAGDIPFVVVKPVARMGLTKAGLDQLIDVLQQTQRNYDQAQQQKTQRTEEGGEG